MSVAFENGTNQRVSMGAAPGPSALAPVAARALARPAGWKTAAADFFVLLSAWAVAGLTWPGEPGVSTATTLITTLLVAISGVALLGADGLYANHVTELRMVEQARLLRLGVRLAAAATILGWALPGPVNPRWVVAGSALSVVGLVAARTVARAWIRSARAAGRYRRPIMLVGIDDRARELCLIMEEHTELGVDLVGIFGSRAAAHQAGMEAYWRGEVDDAIVAAHTGTVTTAALVTTALTPDEVDRVVRQLLAAGCQVQLAPGVSGMDQRRLQPAHLAYEPVLQVESRGRQVVSQAAVKRALDLVVASIVAVLALPVLAISAAALKLGDGGPVLFRQVRIGRYGQPFTFYKLRTMTPDAEARLGDLAVHNERRGPLFKMENDPRVTPVGRVIRGLSIDELPQLWNVLRGDMSVVGPRPALPGEVASFQECLRRRDQVRPGLTGLWQVEARDNPSFRPYERLDLFYLDNWSLGLDLMILVATVENELAHIFAPLVTRRSRRHAPRPVPVRREPAPAISSTEG
jgi:exopolysaccharide biosynthesis polyprenyl glycosylphosphotransferase